MRCSTGPPRADRGVPGARGGRRRSRSRCRCRASGPFVVVGAALAGGTAAATLRDEGFDGRLVLIGDEPELPYERPPLSKTYLRGEMPGDDARSSGPTTWWRGARRRDAPRARACTRSTRGARTVTLADGERVAFDGAWWPPACRNRRSRVPGGDLDGVFHLRTVADADRIRAAAAVGEPRRGRRDGVHRRGGRRRRSARSGLRRHGRRDLRDRALPDPRACGSAGCSSLDPSRPRRDDAIQRHGGAVRGVGPRRTRHHAPAASRSRCDLVIVGVGTAPAADAIDALALADDGGIEVGATLDDEYARASSPRATWPRTPSRLRSRCAWSTSTTRSRWGSTRRAAMLGRRTVFDDPHWFWSDQYDAQIQMGGVRGDRGRWWCGARSRTDRSARSSSTRVGRCGRA